MAIEIVPIDTFRLATGASAFNAMGRLHGLLQSHQHAEIEIDCQKLQWFDAHLASPFMTVVKHARGNGNTVRLRGLAKDVRLILSKNGMLAEKTPDKYSTTIRVTPFKLTEEVQFAKYSRDNLARKQMPKMSPPPKREILRSSRRAIRKLRSSFQLRIWCSFGGPVLPKIIEIDVFYL